MCIRDRLKTERGNRVFPRSDKAADIIDALLRALRRAGVSVVQDRAVSLRREDGVLLGVEGENGFYPGGAAVIATGGVSYPLTGSTGDGYALALSLIHISPLFRGLDEGVSVYFVHSYCAVAEDPADVIAVTDYGAPVTAAVNHGLVYGCQFHPEKSGEVGLTILKNFGGLSR